MKLSVKGLGCIPCTAEQWRPQAGLTPGMKEQPWLRGHGFPEVLSPAQERKEIFLT